MKYNKTEETKDPCRKCGEDMNKCGSEDGMYCMDCYTEDY